jgi:hypothetical protein
LSRLSRFLHLEKARPEEPGARPTADRTGRFRDLGAPTEAVPGSVRSGAAEARFEAAPVEPAERPDDGGLEYIRCRECRRESAAHAVQCSFCESDLRSAAQRAYNETFWRKRREEQEELRREVDALSARQRAADAKIREAAELGRQLTREQAERGESPWLEDAILPDSRDGLGYRLLQQIPNPYLRAAVTVVLLAGLIYAFFSGSQFLIFLVIGLTLLLGVRTRTNIF